MLGYYYKTFIFIRNKYYKYFSKSLRNLIYVKNVIKKVMYVM